MPVAVEKGWASGAAFPRPQTTATGKAAGLTDMRRAYWNGRQHESRRLSDLAVNSTFTVRDPDCVHYLGRVLRMRVGDEVVLFDGEGGELRTRLQAIDRHTLTLHPNRGASYRFMDDRSPVETIIAQSIPKGDRWEWSLRKATELGADGFVPLVPARGVRRPPGRDDSGIGSAEAGTLDHHEQWSSRRRGDDDEAPTIPDSGFLRRAMAVVVDAARQCGRRFVPIVREPQSLSALGSTLAAMAASDNIPGKPPDELRLVFHLPHDHGSPPASLPEALANWPPSSSSPHPAPLHSHDASPASHLHDLGRRPRIVALIGPEGGFAAHEIEEALRWGFRPVHLGPRVLRSETVAPAVLAIIQALVGDGRQPPHPPVWS